MLLAASLFVGTLICLKFGWRLGRRRMQTHETDVDAGQAPIEAAMFALMGLLIAFTFTSAASRFDERRALITHEVNAIGTAWLRLDLLPPEPRAELKNLFREYLDARIALYTDLSDADAVAPALQRSVALQTKIWERLVAVTADERFARLAMVLLPPANEMFDIAQSRLLATRQHPPFAVFLILALLVLVSALFAGHAMSKAKSPSMLHAIAFAAIVSLATYLILDLEYPRLGLLRVDAFDQALLELRSSMN